MTKPIETKTLHAIREAVANYMHSEGCNCCEDYEAHIEHKKLLGVLLNVPMSSDESEYDFSQFRTKDK